MISRILLFLLICLPFQGFAEVYKWIDEQGQTHYGENPPAENASEIKIQDAPGTDNSMQKQNAERDKMLKVYEEERNIRNEEKRITEEENRKKKDKCLVIEIELKKMQRGGALYYDIDEKGERRYLSDAEQARHVKQLQEQYNLYCK